MDGQNWSRRRALRVAAAAGAAVGASTVVSAGSPGSETGTAVAGSRSTEECGPNERTSEETGTISAGESDEYTVAVDGLDERCALEVTLLPLPADGADADLDLYVTLDGRTPTTGDYDRASRGDGADEQVRLTGEEARSTTTVGVLVTGERGSADYGLTAREVGREACSVDSRLARRRGDLDTGDETVHEFTRELDQDCPVDVVLESAGDAAPVYDVFVTRDGRRPSPDDHDRQFRVSDSEGGEVTLDGSVVDQGTTVAALVRAVERGGVYELSLVEHSDRPLAPVADLRVSTREPTEGDPLSLDASESTAREGRRIESFEWEYRRQSFFFGDSGSGSGETFTFTPDYDGYYEVSVAVTDDRGRTDTAYETVQVADGSPWWWPF